MSKLASILALCVAAPALAQPTTMVYQGTLTDLGGDPVTATVSLTFKVFGQETGGAALWTETLDADAEAGFFSVVLGETQALVPSLFPANADRWIEISVEGTALTPRQPLGSAPWALVCGDAQTVGGMTPLTSVTSPGGTLTAGGTGGSRTLDVDYSVMGSCADTTNDKVVGVDPTTGAVQCMSDLQGPGVPGDITAVFPGVGMNFASGGSSGDVTLDLEVPVSPFNGGTGLLGSAGIGNTYIRSDGFGGWFESSLNGADIDAGSVNLSKLANSGCGYLQFPRWDGVSSWVCAGEYASAQPSAEPGSSGTITSSDSLLISNNVIFPFDGNAQISVEAEFSANDVSQYLYCHLNEDGLPVGTYWDWDPGDNDGWYDQRQSHTYQKPVLGGFHTYDLYCFWGGSGFADVSYGTPLMNVTFFPSTL